jgi:hypothetical protein
MRARNLKTMDVNNNGLVDETEYLDYFAAGLERKISAERKDQLMQTETRFDAIDTSKDGQITWDEYWASGQRTFIHFAKSAAGVVSHSAKDKAWDAAPETAQRDASLASQQKSLADIVRPSVIKMPSSHSLAGFIDINDIDGDQQVTADEFQQIRRTIFAATDTDKNGWVAQEEYILDFTERLDRQAKQVRSGQMKQASVRYNVLNTNKDAGISLAEFTVSGERIFFGWDLNDDGLVSQKDPLPRIKTHRHVRINSLSGGVQ